jgi:hypothetical protein
MAAAQCQRDAYAKAMHDVAIRTAPAYASR